MKTKLNGGWAAPSSGVLNTGLAATLGVAFSLLVSFAELRAQPSLEADVQGAEVQTRGPVHEAFAEIVAYNPTPGLVVPKAPPAIIEEVPPDERPEGENITWIPGYWAWDDERNDFLWISGTWRALPPGRAWMAGYWAKTPQGCQWISGYWSDATVSETTYLPAPPETLETGPNVGAPGVDYEWSPGCWVWYSGRYAWRPGYWVVGRPDWSWCPPHYVWTPRGHIFVGGFWDYPVHRRGLLFAPVYFQSGVYVRRGFRYSPVIAINIGLFDDHLFVRPSYCHYYFGDYYAPAYVRGGFYAAFSFQSGRHGYDPIFAHQRWQHRGDRDWERRVETSFQYRRDHEAARPPHTWAAQRSMDRNRPEFRENRLEIAAPVRQMAARTDGPVRFQPVAREERDRLSQRGQEVQKSRDQRRTMEDRGGDRAPSRPGGALPAPVKVTLPASPIVGRSGNQFERGQAPPKPQAAPRPDPKSQPKAMPPGRESEAARREMIEERRNTLPGANPPPGRNTSPPPTPAPSPAPAPEVRTIPDNRRSDVRSAPEVRPSAPSNRPTPEPRATPAPAPADQQKKQRDLEGQLESQRRAQEAATKAQAERSRSVEAERAAQLESQRRANDAAAKGQADAARAARESEMKAQAEAQRRSIEVSRAREAQRIQPAPPARNEDPGAKGRSDAQRNDQKKKSDDKPR